MTADLAFSQLTPACGAEVVNVDVRALQDADIERLRRLVADRGVVVFRDQHPSSDDLLNFARRFGSIVVNRLLPASPEHPEIAEVRKTQSQRVNVGGGWHTDHSYDPAPAMGSVLVARQLPESGGDTLFVNMAEVHDALDEETRNELSELRAVHSTERHFGRDGTYARSSRADELAAAPVLETTHPVIIRHPVTQRRVLFVNPAFTTRFDGQTRDESRDLLGRLFRLAQDPRFQCRLTWSEGDMAMWDNRSTMHRALNDYQGQSRLMHRVTIAGTALAA